MGYGEIFADLVARPLMDAGIDHVDRALLGLDSGSQMIPVEQTNYTRNHGNCLTACVASLLEVPIESYRSSALMVSGSQGLRNIVSSRV